MKKNLTWQKNSVPRSEIYDDIYFSEAGGYEEKKATFPDANNFQDRLQIQRSITIGELGFGTGLTFFITWNEFLKSAVDSAKLFYISSEKYPLDLEDICKACTQGLLKPQIDEFSKKYVPQKQGYQSLSFENGRVNLLLLNGDIKYTLPLLNAEVDIWYLDGFSPSKNPEMWTPEIFNELQRLSAINATLSTYTAAGQVRRDLIEAGFEVEKIAGHAEKRHMLVGKVGERVEKLQNTLPWFEIPQTTEREKTVTIIGAGFAGSAMAYEMSKRGFKVTLIDRRESFALEGSGNFTGLGMPLLSKQPDFISRFSLAAFNATINRFSNASREELKTCIRSKGILKILDSEKEFEKYTSALDNHELNPKYFKIVSAKEATKLSGIKINHPAVHYTEGLAVSPKDICEVNIKNCSNLTTLFNSEAIKLKQENESWQVLDAEGKMITESASVIICNASDCVNFGQTKHLPITKVRGQICLFKETEQSKKLKCSLAFGNYLTVSADGYHVTGATYGPEDSNSEISESENKDMLNELKNSFPSIFADVVPEKSRVNFRATTPDYLPIVGAVHKNDKYLEDFADVKHGKPANHFPLAQYHEGLYISAGHGSRGATTSQISSQIIAAMINNEPIPIEQDILNNIHPARFIIRELRKK